MFIKKDLAVCRCDDALAQIIFYLRSVYSQFNWIKNEFTFEEVGRSMRFEHLETQTHTHNSVYSPIFCVCFFLFVVLTVLRMKWARANRKSAIIVESLVFLQMSFMRISDSTRTPDTRAKERDIAIH